MDDILKARINITLESLSIINLPFIEPVHLPFGTITTRPSAWLILTGTVNNVSARGYAEGTALPMPIPMYDDTGENLAQNIHAILELISNKSEAFSTIKSLISNAKLGGNFATARMTVEAALLDMIARSKQTTVLDLLTNHAINPSQDIAIPYGKSIAETDATKVMTAAQDAVDMGAQRLKFKISPESFEEVYSSLKNIIQIHSDISCMVDANGMFNPLNPHHIEMLTRLDNLTLMTIEEPVSRVGEQTGLDAYRTLHNSMQFVTPLTLDDAIKTKADANAALDENLGDIINLKPGRVGSFIDCVEIAQMAKKKNKQIMVGGMFEATPGRMMTLTLAAYCVSLGFDIPGDLSLPYERLAKDIISDRLTLNINHDVVFHPVVGWGYSL